MISFTIPGKPFAKQRPRSTRQGNVYTPSETVVFERVVGQLGALEMRGRPIIEGPVALTVVATFCPAKSWSKRRRAAAIGQPHTQKPDLDNIVKAIKDGLNRIVWRDDSQVAALSAFKVWGETEQTEVMVAPIDDVGAGVAQVPFRGTIS